MEICEQIAELSRYKGCVIALGTFDGIHIGHRDIIGRAVERARELAAVSVVFTFAEHPLEIIAPDYCPRIIADPVTKQQLIEQMGVDVMLRVQGTVDFFQLSPQDFVELLCHEAEPQQIIVGSNFTFGSNGTGNTRLLSELAGSYGCQVEVRPVVRRDGYPVSSTRIRELLRSGDIENINDMLGAVYVINGRVVKGRQRGRKIGFPTANLQIPVNMAVPGNGVYVTRAIVQGKRLGALTDIGINPTFADVERHIEVHIIDYSADIYGQNIAVEFVHKLRDEIAFEDVRALTEQIKRDRMQAQNFLSRHAYSNK